MGDDDGRFPTIAKLGIVAAASAAVGFGIFKVIESFTKNENSEHAPIFQQARGPPQNENIHVIDDNTSECRRLLRELKS